mmetsp:Transcript_3136/g.2704  ORF Transcript_3136/g.2704 Transcript_3136/m.2704 type:complete len:223 (+) Transcript_3136:418-1086(+)
MISYLLLEYAPYGDLAEFILSKFFPDDEVLVRTIFHQILNGVEYLHSVGVAHLDLKPENILLSKGYSLKITDFDSSVHTRNASNVGTVGTRNYRAPEIRHSRCKDPRKADIYSLGIILFLLKSGTFPYSEIKNVEEGQKYKYMIENGDEAFWESHPSSRENGEQFSPEFRSLFMSMVNHDTEARATIKEIKGTEWFKGKTYSQEELKHRMRQIISVSNRFSN